MTRQIERLLAESFENKILNHVVSLAGKESIFNIVL